MQTAGNLAQKHATGCWLCLENRWLVCGLEIGEVKFKLLIFFRHIDLMLYEYNTIQCTAMQCNTIQYNRTSFIEQNNITTTICTQYWDGWKGGGQKKNLFVIHPQHWLVSVVNVNKTNNVRNKEEIILMHLIESHINKRLIIHF